VISIHPVHIGSINTVYNVTILQLLLHYFLPHFFSIADGITKLLISIMEFDIAIL